MEIDKSQIQFAKYSLVDSFGRVFFYHGRILRGIYYGSEQYCLELLNSDMFKELLQKRYVPKTWVTQEKLEGFSIIIEHELLYASKPHHWSFTMFKDAALLLITVNKICNKYGYELKDAHPFNIFFHKNYPVFIDIGSLAKQERPGSRWAAYEEFANSLYLQLLAWAKGEFFFARKLIEDGNHPVQRTIPMTPILNSNMIAIFNQDLFDFKVLFKGKTIFSTKNYQKPIASIIKLANKVYRRTLGNKNRILSYEKKLKHLNYTEEKIRKLKRPGAKSQWGEYHTTYKLNESFTSTPRFERIIQLIKEKAPDAKSFTDLAGNQGMFCYLLSKSLNPERVVLADYDEKAIDNAYLNFQSNNINIEPYLFNFMNLIKSDDVELIKSDLVLALAVTHHLMLTQRFLLSNILDSIAQYSNKYVLVEFMPLGLWSESAQSPPPLPSYYHLDSFKREFEYRFDILAEENLETNRILFFGRKKPEN